MLTQFRDALSTTLQAKDRYKGAPYTCIDTPPSSLPSSADSAIPPFEDPPPLNAEILFSNYTETVSLYYNPRTGTLYGETGLGICYRVVFENNKVLLKSSSFCFRDRLLPFVSLYAYGKMFYQFFETLREIERYEGHDWNDETSGHLGIPLSPQDPAAPSFIVLKS